MFSSSQQREVTTIQFTTASEPKLLGYNSEGYNEVTENSELVILTSEPIHPDDAAALEFDVGNADDMDQNTEIVFIGIDSDEPRLIRYEIIGGNPREELTISGDSLRAQEDDNTGEPFMTVVNHVSEHPLLQGSSYCGNYYY